MSMIRLRRQLRGAALLLGSGMVLPISVCVQGENSVEFRNAAVPKIEQGVETLVTGLFSEDDGTAVSAGLESIIGGFVDGFFVVLQPD
jgi:hypothetical protein